MVVHTGGTTGSPKGVMLTDNNFNGIAMQFSACDTLFSKGQSLLNIMPPFIGLRLCLRRTSAADAGHQGGHHPQPRLQ